MQRYVLTSIVAFFLLPALAQDWLGFHGLEQQGVSRAAPSALDWSRGIDTIWKTAIPGSGFSSPVVVGDRVYLTTAYETNRGATIKTAVFHVIVTLAFALLAVIGVSTIGSLGLVWPAKQRYVAFCRGLSLVGIILFVLGISLFGDRLFNLDQSNHRSWKVATLVAALGSYVMLLLAGSQTMVRWLFVVSSTFLSLLAYLFMPKRELFLNFSSSDGLISTFVVLVPSLLAWGILVGLSFLSASRPAQSPTFTMASLRVLALRAAFCFGLPALLVASLFWGLMQRVLRHGNPQVSFAPSVGWPYVVIATTICLAAIVVGGISVRRESRSISSRVSPSIIGSLLLALGSFVGFGCLPAQKQVAFAVLSLDGTNGQIHWLREVAFSSDLRDLKEINSRATPTLAVSSDLICAYFGSAGLFGLDRSGNVRWRVKGADFQGDFGVGHSPTIADNVVVLLNDNELPRNRPAPKSQIAAYDLSDGQLLWRHERSRSEPGSAGFTTPAVRTLRGAKAVLVRGWEDLTAYDLITGKVRWTYPLKHRGDHLVASLVSDEKRLYLMDATRVLALEFDALEASRADPLWVVPLPGEKDATPVVIDGLLFAATETGVVVCIDVESGALKWRQKFRERFFASVVSMGNGVLFAGELGNLMFTSRCPDFTLLSEHSFGEKIYATPVPLAARVLIRTKGHLYCMAPKDLGI